MVKKAIVAICLTLILILATILEGRFVATTFRTIDDDIGRLKIALDADKENIDSEYNIALAQDIYGYWEQRRGGMQMIISQIFLAEFDFKIESLVAHVIQNDYNMADTDIMLIIASCKIMDEQYTPRLSTVL